MKYGLEDLTVKKIQNVFAGFPQVQNALLYGSRATGNYKPGSDLDITLQGQNLNLSVMGQIGSQLDDLLLPYIFDLSVFSQIKNDDLIDHIKRVGVRFYSRQIEYKLD